MYIYIKMVNRFYKKQRKALKTSTWKTSKSFCGRKRKEKSEKRPETDLKNFLKKKKKKHHQHHCNRNKNLSEEEKQKKVEYMRIYYLANKENCKLFFQGSIK